MGDDALWAEAANYTGIDPGRWARVFPDASDQAQKGGAVAWAISCAVRLALEGQVDAICTAPIHKSLLHQAGFGFPGHTEFLAHLCGLEHNPLMVLAGPKLTVATLTTHVRLGDVPSLLSVEGVYQQLATAWAFAQRELALDAPRLALAALNPHGGEDGRFGDEEMTILAPAVQRCAAQGIRVDGPISADTVFVQALHGAYDMVIAPTHDQALIAIKVAHFGAAVHITAGLPFVRTSPDHGTAMEKKGTPDADPSSMIHALSMAAKLAHRRRRVRA